MMKVLIVLAVLSCSVLGAVLRNDNITLKRATRSCDPCDYHQHQSLEHPSFQRSHASAAAEAHSYNHFQNQGSYGPSRQDLTGQGYYNGNSHQGQLAQGSLRGALDLTSQGQQAPGCRTCGGGNAISNARSYSGNAVAVSVGG